MRRRRGLGVQKRSSLSGAGTSRLWVDVEGNGGRRGDDLGRRTSEREFDDVGLAT